MPVLYKCRVNNNVLIEFLEAENNLLKIKQTNNFVDLRIVPHSFDFEQ